MNNGFGRRSTEKINRKWVKFSNKMENTSWTSIFAYTEEYSNKLRDKIDPHINSLKIHKIGTMLIKILISINLKQIHHF